MTLRRFALASSFTSARSGAVLALVAFAGVGAIATANTEAVVAKRLTAALEAPAHQPKTKTAESRALVSGTEAYWLAERQRLESDGASVEPAAWSGPRAAGLAVGDRFTIPGDKSDRVLQVIAIADVEPAPGTLQAHSPASSSAREIAITCRDLSASNSHAELVTFVIPANTNLASERPAQTL